jgi:hypothetical protein
MDDAVVEVDVAAFHDAAIHRQHLNEDLRISYEFLTNVLRNF